MFKLSLWECSSQQKFNTWLVSFYFPMKKCTLLKVHKNMESTHVILSIFPMYSLTSIPKWSTPPFWYGSFGWLRTSCFSSTKIRTIWMRIWYFCQHVTNIQTLYRITSKFKGSSLLQDHYTHDPWLTRSLAHTIPGFHKGAISMFILSKMTRFYTI